MIYTSPLIAIAVFIMAMLIGCLDSESGYVPASSISEDGLALDPGKMRRIDGQEIRLWGFVDHGNLYGNDRVKTILQEWWSGYGPSPATWSFNLKADKDDKIGQSFKVTAPNDPWRDDVFRMFLADAKAHKPTKVYARGRIFTFAMPINIATPTGLYLELEFSRDIVFRTFPE
jgi:hypothetical protein